MLSLRFGAASAPKPGASGLTQMFNVARTGTSGTQVTTGVRGLDAEQLATAQPNPAELARLEKFAADRDPPRASLPRASSPRSPWIIRNESSFSWCGFAFAANWRTPNSDCPVLTSTRWSIRSRTSARR